MNEENSEGLRQHCASQKLFKRFAGCRFPVSLGSGSDIHSLLRDLRDHRLSLFLLTKNIYVGDSKILMLMLMAIPKYVCMYVLKGVHKSLSASLFDYPDIFKKEIHKG